MLPEKLIDSPDLLESWVRASDPILDEILSMLYEQYFSVMQKEKTTFQKSEFVFKVSVQILSMDETYNNMLSALSKSNGNFVFSYLRLMETVPFNNRTFMMLHLLYTEANKRFPDTQAPSRVLSSTICDGHLLANLKVLAPKANLSELTNLVSFAQTAVSLEDLKRYESILNQYKKQPKDFEPVRRGALTFEAFTQLLLFAEKIPLEFVNIFRRNESQHMQ